MGITDLRLQFVSVLECGLLDPLGALVERDGLSQMRGDSFETVNESRQGGVDVAAIGHGDE